MTTAPQPVPQMAQERIEDPPQIERSAQRVPLRLPLGLSVTWLALAGIVVLAAALRLANLDELGNANAYYTAAVESMLQSRHNLFYAAAEPGGSVSVDKPPVGLWLQALSAAVLGVSGFAVVLPQLLAGLGSLLLLFHLVRRSFGDLAGLLAALALAVTPVAVAVERNNTPDATLIFTLLLAAWAFLSASETGRLRPLLLGALLVGVGFNIKMLQAYLVLPALYALYLFGAQQRWGRRLAGLVLATLVLSAVSLSWALAVDLTPTERRPYVGGSSDNSVLDLIAGYNGLRRLAGNAGPAGGPPGAAPPQAQADAGAGGPVGPGGAFGTGEAGLLRMFQAGLAAQASWLLPFGLLAALGLAASLLRRPGELALRRGLLLWGGWLLTCVGFFSVAGFFHQYYLAMLAPPLAALVGIGLARLWSLREEQPLLAVLLPAAAITLAYQLYAVTLYQPLQWWAALAALLGVAGLALLLPRVTRARPALSRAGFASLCAALLLIPAVWSGLTSASAASGGPLPQAYGGPAGQGGPGMGLPPGAPGAAGSPQPRASADLLAYLQSNTQDTRYMLVVPSSMLGAPYVIASGRPVLYAGGFNGSDPVLDGAGLVRMVARGEVRYVLWGGSFGPGGPAARAQTVGISNYLQSSACTVVPGLDLGAGAPPPPGARPGPPGARPGLPPGRGVPLRLYRCGS